MVNESGSGIAIGVLTSGGDAQGMNAALRAIVRTAINQQSTVYAIHNGYQGMVDGGDQIRALDWGSVGGIMQRGGTVIGTARCAAFRERAGRLQAARNLVLNGIDRLIVIGGDGSLTGADIFRKEWPSLLAELVEQNLITPELARRHPFLGIAGLVGSIDNDFCGTDMTIGVDSALHRITEAIDALTSTAASHHRTFVVEVMGRNCGYLALTGAIAGGADYVLIPEMPPGAGWEDQMCDLLHAGRVSGRRESIVVVSEGARDITGAAISSQYVKEILEQRLSEEVRITILGHVQRGGSPSAYDRWMSSLLGYAAVEEILSMAPETEPKLIGIQNNRIVRIPLMQCVEDTRAVLKAIQAGDYKRAMTLRGGDFAESYETFQLMANSVAKHTPKRVYRLAIMHAGSPAPGMNTAVRAAVRLALSQGHQVLGIQQGFEGFAKGWVTPLQWGSVDGWELLGGANLGTTRHQPTPAELAAIAQVISDHHIEGLLIIGGWTAYTTSHMLLEARPAYPEFGLPVICLPASINNNLPGSELSVGTDTALNTIVEVLDKIKQSAVAVKRCFVVDVMGRHCGYLAQMSSLASGSERTYLHEDEISLELLRQDLETMRADFAAGKRLSILIRNEDADPLYTASFLCALFEKESRGMFDVRQAVLGHMQEGGNPSPFDRIEATRLAARCVTYLIDALDYPEKLDPDQSSVVYVGLANGRIAINDMRYFPSLCDLVNQRPKQQWWLELKPVAEALARHKTVS